MVEHVRSSSEKTVQERKNKPAKVLLFVAGPVGEAIKAHVEACGDSIVQEESPEVDWIITAYIPYLIKPDCLAKARKGTINCHPALLPYGRGWYPHVWNIINGTKAGVTLHQLWEKADAGPIWAQKEVKIEEYDTAKTIHEKLQNANIALFKESWEKYAMAKYSQRPRMKQKQFISKKVMFQTLILLKVRIT